MSTKVIVDYRRKDQRRYIYSPYWITSGEFSALELGSAELKMGLLFSFPAAQYGTTIILVEKVCVQITEAFVTGTITVDIGKYTILTDGVTTGGLATDVDYNWVVNADVTHGTLGYYFASGSAFLTARALQTEGANVRIVPLDAVVPCTGVHVTSDSTMTAGKGRVHMLITEIPIV
jgi:hypothetical protein